MTTANLAYPDLTDSQYVFNALLGYGMFSEKLPPCFDSSMFLEFMNKNMTAFKSLSEESKSKGTPTPQGAPSKPKHEWHRNYIKFSSIGHTHVPREMGVPHPYTYFLLCEHIKKNWDKINSHIGKGLSNKINYCHVRKIKNKPFIFEMNYKSGDKYIEEELEIEYKLEAKYVVYADISKCFSSIYSHSIPWAICTKKEAKKNNKTRGSEKNKIDKLWFNILDKKIMNLSDQQTVGIIIGPHASNIISEIILSEVDRKLIDKGFTSVIRNIDDYSYYASSEEDAIQFITRLRSELQEFELSLNDKKTHIDKLPQADRAWRDQLHCFTFPQIRNEIGFTSISNYLRLSECLAIENENGAPINYAIKTIRNRNLSVRAKKLFINSLFEMSIKFPYLFLLIEDTIKKVSPQSLINNEQFEKFLNLMFRDSWAKKQANCLSYVFYLAVKYEYNINIACIKDSADDTDDTDNNKIISKIHDCIFLLLLYEYCKRNKEEQICNDVMEIAREKNNSDPNERDSFWLLSYELLEENELTDESLKILKKNSISFLNLKVNNTLNED